MPARADDVPATAEQSRTPLLLVGTPTDFTTTIAATLSKAGYAPVPAQLDDIPASAIAAPPPAILVLPPVLDRVDARIPVEDFIDALDAILVPAGLMARDLVARRGADQGTRIVVLLDSAVTGPAHNTVAAAAMGGLLGLARSWALEFAPLLVTVNVVVIGFDPAADPGAPRLPHMLPQPDVKAVAHAVAFFLDPRAASITGQVLSVCGGRLASGLPL
ncbi:SDR family oxidoreductase [Belnapia mucosa]|nr:SDR family oxidoreductase [Belnapia mucosa]